MKGNVVLWGFGRREGKEGGVSFFSWVSKLVFCHRMLFFASFLGLGF